MDKIVEVEMSSMDLINEFLAKKNIAIIGVSRKQGKFGNIVYKELKKKGYSVFGVNPNLELIEGDKCYNNISELKGRIEAVVSVVPGTETEKIILESDEININYIWMQQGSETKKAIKMCKDLGINEVHKECILMFAEPVKSIHSIHRWIWKVLGRLPN